eukprot:gene433-10104_t
MATTGSKEASQQLNPGLIQQSNCENNENNSPQSCDVFFEKMWTLNNVLPFILHYARNVGSSSDKATEFQKQCNEENSNVIEKETAGQGDESAVASCEKERSAQPAHLQAGGFSNKYHDVSKLMEDSTYLAENDEIKITQKLRKLTFIFREMMASWGEKGLEVTEKRKECLDHKDSDEEDGFLNRLLGRKNLGLFDDFKKISSKEICSKLRKNITFPKQLENLLELICEDDDSTIDSIDLEANQNLIAEVCDLEDRITKKMKEDGGLKYKNGCEEEVLLKYDALPPLLKLKEYDTENIAVNDSN